MKRRKSFYRRGAETLRKNPYNIGCAVAQSTKKISASLRLSSWLLKCYGCIDQFADTRHGDDIQTVDGCSLSWHIAAGDDGCFETVFGGFAQSLLAIGYGAYLASQADFAKSEYVVRQRFVSEA